MFTREWPPLIYGGAGVHVEQLVAHLRTRIAVEVQCFGEDRAGAEGFAVPAELTGANGALQALGTDLLMANGTPTVDLVHSHTWYTNLAGHLAGLLHNVPHVITAHSLEPLRPWKAQQLGSGYAIASWVEEATYRDARAIIAVSEAMRADLLDVYPLVAPDRVHVVHNGIDTNIYRPDPKTDVLSEFGVDMPYVLFVGRITPQKGITHLLHAFSRMESPAQLVLCASAPDTPELGAEVAALVATVQRERGANSVVWIDEAVAPRQLIQLLTHAAVFACPSIYEPLGIVNLEAMACETAVVASAVGGIPEVVADGETGVLVPFNPEEPHAFAVAFADALDTVLAQPSVARAMGAAGRARAVGHFTWDRIAEQTIDIYQAAIDS
jgi:starch synthase